MTTAESNRYTPFFASDNDLCSLVLPKERIDAILLETRLRAAQMEGEGDFPKVFFDLEHLQVADYTNFPLLQPEQQEAIRKVQKKDPVRTDDMIYLALRSLICFQWDKPESETDVRRAAAYEKALELVLARVSEEVSESLESENALLPYWGRLAFLRVMATIPEEQIEAYGLSSIGCMLLKEPVFNARSFQYENHGLIGLNYALEPVLKCLNRMLLHFFHTQEFAGPKRMERVLGSLVPIVAYFWANTPVRAYKLTPYHALFDDQMAAMAHQMTAIQVDFIVRHELGHLVLRHGPRMQGRPKSEETTALKHEFEFAADTFAQGSLRSSLYLHLRDALQWSACEKTPQERSDAALLALQDHQSEVTGVRLLFLYMKVIDALGNVLKTRLGSAIMFRTKMDSHPSPSTRISQLNVSHIGEHAPTSQVIRYAERLFEDVMEHAGALDDAALAKTMEGLY